MFKPQEIRKRLLITKYTIIIFNHTFQFIIPITSVIYNTLIQLLVILIVITQQSHVLDVSKIRNREIKSYIFIIL